MRSKRIAITGGIATGKSTASRHLRRRGYPVIEADAVAREALAPGAAPYRAVVKAFGEEILTENGDVNRDALGRIIFVDATARETLNEITHPWIRARMIELGEKAEGSIVFYDIPLYFESKDPLPVEEVWLIDADEHVQMQRLMARDGIERTYAQQKIAAQMPMDEKRRRADRIIANNGSEEELTNTLDSILKR